jgi:hypothetical protein
LSPAALILLQAATAATGPTPTPLDAARHCGPGKDGAIVVCARPAERSPYRLPLPAAPEQGPRKVTFHLPGAVAGDVHLEQHARQGIPDHRIMVHLSKKF